MGDQMSQLQFTSWYALPVYKFVYKFSWYTHYYNYGHGVTIGREKWGDIYSRVTVT